MTQYAVLTGDIVSSTALKSAELRTALELLQSASAEVSEWVTPTFASRFTTSRGDGWQIVLNHPALALRAALYLQAALMRYDPSLQTRIAIATGPATLPEGADLNVAGGPAFTASGRVLEKMTTGLITHADAGPLGAVTRLADHIAQGWTAAQARAMFLMLPPDPPTHTGAAKQLGISRQAVDKALRSAGFSALSEALTMVEVNISD